MNSEFFFFFCIYRPNNENRYGYPNSYPPPPPPLPTNRFAYDQPTLNDAIINLIRSLAVPPNQLYNRPIDSYSPSYPYQSNKLSPNIIIRPPNDLFDQLPPAPVSQ